MIAILSDVHANLEALIAVLDDVKKIGAEQIVCLGDVVGYGPNPRECLELMAHNASVMVLGNHEDAVFNGADEGFNRFAKASVQWTRNQLIGDDAPEGFAEKAKSLLTGFQIEATDNGIKYVHASPVSPTREYVVPRTIYDGVKMAELYAAFDKVCFIGHTHLPGIFTHDGYERPEDLPGGLFFIEDGKPAIVNVGSVGQPRDSNTKACYATIDVDSIRFHRVEYDTESVVAKIKAVPMLHDSLGDRLLLGR